MPSTRPFRHAIRRRSGGPLPAENAVLRSARCRTAASPPSRGCEPDCSKAGSRRLFTSGCIAVTRQGLALRRNAGQLSRRTGRGGQALRREVPFFLNDVETGQQQQYSGASTESPTAGSKHGRQHDGPTKKARPRFAPRPRGKTAEAHSAASPRARQPTARRAAPDRISYSGARGARLCRYQLRLLPSSVVRPREIFACGSVPRGQTRLQAS
jgi:hypothetical protein